MEAREEEITVKGKEGNKSKCGDLCHNNMLDYVLLIRGSSNSRVRSSSNHTYRLYLRNLLCSPSSAVGIKVDLSSRKKRKGLWLGVTCFECVRIRDKLKDVVYSLVARLDGLIWATDVMLREFSKSNRRFCRLFLARIFADDWKKHLVFVSDAPCSRSHQLPFCNLGLIHKDSLNGGPNKLSSISNLSNHAIENHQDKEVTLDTDNGTCNEKCHNVSKKIGKVVAPLKRKRGKEEKKVSMENIYSYLSRNFTIKEAAEGLGVSRSTLKRKCRQLGISRWPPSKGKRRCRRSSQGDKVPEFAPQLEVASLKSVSSEQDVASQYMGGSGTPNGNKIPRLGSSYEAASLETLSSEDKYVADESGSGLKAASQKSTSSAKDYSQSFSNITLTYMGKDGAEFGSSTRNVSQYRPIDRNLGDQRSLLLLPYMSWEENQPKSFSHAWNCTKVVQLSNDTTMHGRLAYSNEKSSSSSASLGQTSGVLSPLIQQDDAIEGVTWLIKATYKDDMVRFHCFFKPNFAELKKEVARRLNLKLGTFKVKYMDDEDEWALLASDLDWKEFMYISKSSRTNVVRLLIQDWRMEEEHKDDLQATLLKL